jgi:hypothetical protein
VPFTAQELSNVANATLNFHERGPAQSSAIQARPLLKALDANKKTFPGGKEFITTPVKGVYTTAIQGFTHDDTVAYQNPANIKRASAKWYETHSGISVTLTELKIDGISVVDSTTSDKTTEHSDVELTRLTGLLEDKLDDMAEGTARTRDEMFWRDGTQDSKVVPGILSFILDTPSAAGSTFGIDRTANTWWRNRASLAIDSSTASNQNLVQTLQKEIRQLRRYGKGPTHFFAGSDFLDAFEKELRSKGNYTLEGWNKTNSIDASVADVAFKGMMIEYVPMLDDLSRAKYGYWLDMKGIQLRPMEGEENKKHSPARPPEKYVLYKAITNTEGLIAKQLNTSGCYSIA